MHIFGASLDIFFRVAKDLGIDFDAIPDGTAPGDWVKLPVGRKYHFEIVHNPSKTDPSRVFANFRNITGTPEEMEIAGPSTPAGARFRTQQDYGVLWTFGLRSTF